MNEYECNFDFDELVPTIEDTVIRGMMLYGTAVLASADPGEPDAFYVKEVIIDGGFRLLPSGAGEMGVPSEYRKLMFKAIASIIESDKNPTGRAAQECFTEERRADGVPDPDYLYDAMRDRQMEAHL